MKTIRQARKDAGFTQADMARLLGTSLVSYGKWENGKTKISARDFINFCFITGDDLTSIILPST